MDDGIGGRVDDGPWRKGMQAGGSQRFHPRRLGSGDKTMAANRGPDICLSMPYSVSCRWESARVYATSPQRIKSRKWNFT